MVRENDFFLTLVYTQWKWKSKLGS